MGAARKKQDALVLLGDNTENGGYYQYTMLYSILSQYNKAAQTLAAIGNHDLNMDKYNTPDAIDRFNYFLQSYTGESHKTVPYYSQKIKGCTFVVLGDEGPQHNTSATLSQAQLDWLDQTLAEAQNGRPVFVFLHQPLNHAFPQMFRSGWGGVGNQSADLRRILRKYRNVFMFTGHLHAYENEIVTLREDGVTYINVPTLLKREVRGFGWQVEVYPGKVLLRLRNYIAGAWHGRQYEVPVG
jgi:hypothetical protein